MKDISKLNHYNIDQMHFIDKETKELSMSYLASIKNDGDHVISYRISKCREFIDFTSKFLCKNVINNIKRKDLISYITNGGKMSCKHICMFLEFCQGYLTNDLKKLLNYKTLLCSPGGTKEKLIALCNAEHIEQYVLKKKKKKPLSSNLFMLDIPYEYPLFNVAVSFIEQSTYRISEFTYFVENLYRSFNNVNIKDIYDFNLETFKNSIEYYYNKESRLFMSLVMSFFHYCAALTGYNFFEDASLNIKILDKPGLAYHIATGYELIVYSYLDNIPRNDKWALAYDKKHDKGTFHPSSEVLYFNFSEIREPNFRYMTKEFVWRSQKSLRVKRNILVDLKHFFNYVSDLREGRELSIFCKPGRKADHDITIDEINAYITHLNHLKLSQRTIVTKMDHVRCMFSCLSMQGHDIPKGVFYALYNRNSYLRANTSKAIPDHELELIHNVLLQNAKKEILYAVYYAIFYLAINTELRISEIVSLRQDCVIETLKKGEYILLSRRKDDTTEYAEIPITQYTKRQIDIILDITKDLRVNSTDNVKELLFIVPGSGTFHSRVITVQNFRKYFQKECKNAVSKEYSPQNLRDTYMTKALRLKLKEGLSDIELSALTGHNTTSVLTNNYADLSVEEMLELTHGIIIGNVDHITGEILSEVPDYIATKENEVANQCGYCKSDSCNSTTLLDCLMCSSFVTTPSKRGFFEKQIRIINYKIKNAACQHDREDLVAIKKLHLFYICAIDKLEVNNNDISN